MEKNKLKEEFFNHLTETPSPGREGISRVAAAQIRANSLQPPDALWLKIQKKITEQPAATRNSFIQTWKSFFSPPLVPALALGVCGILVGAFILLNRGTNAAQVPLVEISTNTVKQKGDVLVAKGIQIQNLAGGIVSRISGNTEKIIFNSGSWQMALVHKDLEKPVQFIFPGGALEPLGTVFTVAIGKDGTAITLTEGKVRLFEYQSVSESNVKKWKNSMVMAPFNGVLKGDAVNADVKMETEAVGKKQVPASKYANYVGKNITVELKNGDRLSGRLRGAAGGALSLSGTSGNLRIREADVLRINRN